MKFVLLIHQGTTPLPESARWNALSEAEQKAVYADYAQINQAPGVTPGFPLGLPEAARTVASVRSGAGTSVRPACSTRTDGMQLNSTSG